MIRFVIIEKHENGTETLVSHICEMGEFDLLFRDIPNANLLLRKVQKARKQSKFIIKKINI